MKCIDCKKEMPKEYKFNQCDKCYQKMINIAKAYD